MKPRPAAASLRRLVPLTAAVAAVHVVLLQPGSDPVAPPAPPAPAFATRSVVPPPPPEPPPPPPAAARAAPAPAATPLPRPRPAVREARAAAPAPTPPRRPQVAEGPIAAPVPAPAPALATPPAPEPAPAPSPSPPASPQAAETAASAPAAAGPVAIPPPMRLHYEVTAHWRGIPVRGRAELAWRHDGSTYEASFEASTLGRSRQQRSTGRLTAGGLAPDYFWEKSRKEQAAHFERDRGRVVFSNNRPSAQLVPGLQDRLSVVLQLSALLAARPGAFPPGTQLTLPTAGTGDAEDWNFTVQGEEDLDLPGGPVRAVKLQRLPRKEYDQRVELWLAPGMDYAPVRLRLTNPNGDAADQRWASTDR